MIRGVISCLSSLSFPLSPPSLSQPVIYAVIVGAIFLLTSLAFMTYDYLVTNNQNRLTRMAARSTHIVGNTHAHTHARTRAHIHWQPGLLI